MSMREYGFEDIGLIIAKNEIIYMANIFLQEQEGDNFAPIEDDIYDAYDCLASFVEMTGNFSGDSAPITQTGIPDYASEYARSYDSDTIFYIPIKSYPNLFYAAYDNKQQIIDEYKELYGKYLPEDFGYENRICNIIGTVWG